VLRGPAVGVLPSASRSGSGCCMSSWSTRRCRWSPRARDLVRN